MHVWTTAGEEQLNQPFSALDFHYLLSASLEHNYYLH